MTVYSNMHIIHTYMYVYCNVYYVCIVSVDGENKLPPTLTMHSLVTSPDAAGLIPKIHRECLRLHYTFLASFTKQVLPYSGLFSWVENFVNSASGR